jgi:hypothetical protein
MWFTVLTSLKPSLKFIVIQEMSPQEANQIGEIDNDLRFRHLDHHLYAQRRLHENRTTWSIIWCTLRQHICQSLRQQYFPLTTNEEIPRQETCHAIPLYLAPYCRLPRPCFSLQKVSIPMAKVSTLQEPHNVGHPYLLARPDRNGKQFCARFQRDGVVHYH